MLALRSLTMLFWQSGDALSGRDVHLLMIFAGIIAAALVTQAIAVTAAAGFGAKLLKKIETLSDNMEQKTTPILVKTNALLEDLSPKIRSISTNAEEISYTVREKVDELGETISQLRGTVEDMNYKTRVHVLRVDGIVTDALETAAEVSVVVQEGIRTPVRQIAGIIAGFKAGLETLIARSPFGK